MTKRMMSKALEVVKSFAGKRALITGASSGLIDAPESGLYR
jgi:hypothetical protein